MERVVVIAVLVSLALAGCDYDVPITAEPTRGIEAALLGDWIGSEPGKNLCRDHLLVRKYDDRSYVISLDGGLLRAWHSDVAGEPFLTAQELDSTSRKYCYFRWSLGDDGRSLLLHPVNTDLVPKDTPDSAAVVKLLQANAEVPALLKAPLRFMRTD